MKLFKTQVEIAACTTISTCPRPGPRPPCCSPPRPTITVVPMVGTLGPGGPETGGGGQSRPEPGPGDLERGGESGRDGGSFRGREAGGGAHCERGGNCRRRPGLPPRTRLPAAPGPTPRPPPGAGRSGREGEGPPGSSRSAAPRSRRPGRPRAPGVSPRGPRGDAGPALCCRSAAGQPRSARAGPRRVAAFGREWGSPARLRAGAGRLRTLGSPRRWGCFSAPRGWKLELPRNPGVTARARPQGTARPVPAQGLSRAQGAEPAWLGRPPGEPSPAPAGSSHAASLWELHGAVVSVVSVRKIRAKRRRPRLRPVALPGRLPAGRPAPCGNPRT